LQKSSNFKSIDTINHFYIKGQLSAEIVIKKEKNKTRKELQEKIEDKELEKKIPNPIDKKEIEDLSKNKEFKIIQTRINKSIKIDKEQNIQSREKKLDQREMQIIRRINQIEVREKKLNEKELLLKQREIQLEQRELLIDLREKQLEQDLMENIKDEKQKIVEKKKKGRPSNQKKGRGKKTSNPKSAPSDLSLSEDSDQIIHPNIKGELNIPIGHYAIINSHNKANNSTKFSIYGLGSGIALILMDKVNKVYAISNMIEPKSSSMMKDSSLIFPHRYIDTSVNVLLDKLLYYGANRETIEAIVIGGAKNIYEKESISQNNIDAIKIELFSNHIRIEKDFLGGISELSIIYDTEANVLYLKKKWEDQFRKVFSN